VSATQANSTADRILDIAEALVQTRGFNGFSYAAIANELGVTTASLHYHFRGKAALGVALIDRYAERFLAALERIDGEAQDAPVKLAAYADLYAQVVRGERMCLCGILAAEYQALPKPMREAVVRFFDDNEAWLARVVKQGSSEGTLSLDGSPRRVAQSILGGLEGAMLLARPYGDVARFQSTAALLLASFTA